MAKENNYITVEYKMFVSDEKDEIKDELTEETPEGHPFLFITNMDCVLPAFEQAICQLKAGETFDFVIPCTDAYGEFDDQLMFDVSKKIFEINGKFDDEHIFEGNVVPLQAEDGSRFNGTIIEVKADAVTIDLNHLRAGKDLHFVGKVIENRPATVEEIADMAKMLGGEGCGHGCGGCGGGCGHDCEGECGGEEHHCGCGCGGHCH